MNLQLKNPITALRQHTFTLPQIISIVILVALVAFAGGRYWQDYQKDKLARQNAAKAAQEEAERLSKLNDEAQLVADEETKPPEPPPPAPEQKPAETAKPKAVFSLKGSKVSNGVSLVWDVQNLTVTNGFLLLKSKESNPAYGSSSTESLKIKDSSLRNYALEITNGKTYYFRVCIWSGSTCTSYSNIVSVAAPYVAPAPPSGSLVMSAGGGASVNWTLSGSAPYGYKLVWTPDPGTPSYPGGGSANFYDKGTTTGIISGDPGVTYNVRICAYYEGSCAFYSNQVQVAL